MIKKLNNILISNDDGYESIGLKVLLNIAERLADNKLEDEEKRNARYSDYANYARSDDIQGQKFIHDILKDRFLNELKKLEMLDPKRAFDDVERYVIFQNSNGRCQGSEKDHW